MTKRWGAVIAVAAFGLAAVAGAVATATAPIPDSGVLTSGVLTSSPEDSGVLT